MVALGWKHNLYILRVFQYDLFDLQGRCEYVLMAHFYEVPRHCAAVMLKPSLVRVDLELRLH